MMNTETANPKPRSRRQFFSWLIYEPILFRKYEKTLTKKQKVVEFLKSYPWIILFTVTIWLIANAVVVSLDLPPLFPDQFGEEIVEEYRGSTYFLEKLFLLIQNNISYFVVYLAVGLAGVLSFGLAEVLSIGLVFGLLGGFSEGLSTVLGVGIVWFIVFNIFYFRLLPFYPIRLRQGLFRQSLSKNIYRKDGMIWLPVPGLKDRLIKEAYEKPREADEFIDFLLKYRPLQKTLAMDLTHAAAAGSWVQKDFNKDVLKRSPAVSEDRPKLRPSREWYEKLEMTREALAAFEQQNNIGFKVEYFEKYLQNIREFAEVTLKRESSRWNHYYVDALDRWRQQAEDELKQLKRQAQTQEPITANKYRAGEALTPEFDRDVFVGREGLRDNLQTRILSSRSMPMFLIHGQRRVGKTSLLKFLAHILGPGFKVVYLDLQPIGGVSQWFEAVQKKTDDTLGVRQGESIEYLEDNWPESWKRLQHYLEKSAQSEEYKIVLAFDEYEKIHQHLQTNPQAAADLLGAMRSFSQHQNRVVFLFVGAALFTELEDPDWSTYFVQAVLLKVDYLKREDAFRLIRVARLDYPQEVLEEIYRLTQGHPALLQKICYEMVNMANTNNRKKMTRADLEEILGNHIFVSQNGVTDVFWKQFCRQEAMKAAVRQIISGEEPTDKKSVFKLREHGFIVKENDHYRMRVPIFDMWLKQYGDYI
jgi:AAA+ ATPase superfamily predicted ATPase